MVSHTQPSKCLTLATTSLCRPFLTHQLGSPTTGMPPTITFKTTNSITVSFLYLIFRILATYTRFTTATTCAAPPQPCTTLCCLAAALAAGYPTFLSTPLTLLKPYIEPSTTPTKPLTLTLTPTLAAPSPSSIPPHVLVLSACFHGPHVACVVVVLCLRCK